MKDEKNKQKEEAEELKAKRKKEEEELKINVERIKPDVEKNVIAFIEINEQGTFVPMSIYNAIGASSQAERIACDNVLSKLANMNKITMNCSRLSDGESFVLYQFGYPNNHKKSSNDSSSPFWIAILIIIILLILYIVSR